MRKEMTLPLLKHLEYAKIGIPVLFLICIALVITSGCMSSPSVPPISPPTTVIPETSPPATTPPATVEIMTRTASCQITDSVSIEGTVKSTASRPVTIVVRGSTYYDAGTKLGSGSDFIDIDPNGTSAFKIIVPHGCGPWEWKYDVWIDEVL
jgi:hypothetical protein